MTPQVVDVDTRPNYKLFVRFKGKGVRIVDMRPFIRKGIFRELANEKYFRKVRVIWGGIEWPNEQDLSAETLFEIGKPVGRPNKSLQRTSAANGQRHRRRASRIGKRR